MEDDLAINLTHLRSFWAVARCGGFSAAADFLRVSQPTLTRQIRDLEEGYGVVLFNRDARATTLTPQGEALLPVAERVFAEAGEAETLLRRHSEPVIRLATVTTDLATKLVAAFQSTNPEIALKISVGTSMFVREAVVDRRSDIGILTLVDNDDALEAVELGRFPLLVVLPDGHPCCGSGPISIVELADEPIITGSVAAQSRVHLESAARRAGVSLNVAQEIDSYEMVLALVRLGLGVGVIGYTGITERGESTIRPLAECASAIPVHVAVLQSQLRAKVIAYAFRFASSVLSDKAAMRPG